MNEIKEGKTGQLSGDYKHTTKQGDEIWTHYKLFALPTPSDQNLKYVVIAEDITEKLAAERRLKYSEKNTGTYLTNLPLHYGRKIFLT
ncbi:PAS domain S-box protein [Niabella hibiscisoli]|uniref:PAS domain S-box protein n=1 Tax=Niabella hibiscisoli TaxID=1825928 RepID=UPI00374DE6E3